MILQTDEWMLASSTDATLVDWVSRARKPSSAKRLFLCGTRTSEVVFESRWMNGVIYLAIFDAHV